MPLISVARHADQRYYATGSGRFLSADPYKASAGPSDPGSWNRYSYTRGDPVGRYDPRGLEDQEPGSKKPPVWCPTLERYIEDGEICPGIPDASPAPTKVCQNGSIVGQNDPCPFDDPVMAAGLGLSNASRGLKVISEGGFKSKVKCAAFFGALAKSRGVSAQSLMDGVAAAAGAGQVFEGTDSNEALDSERFPGAASPGVNTVGQWFGQNDLRYGLSQHNGNAIWVRSSFFATSAGTQPYGLGVLLHEFLHKQWLGGAPGHDDIDAALDAVGAPGRVLGQGESRGSRLEQICF